MGVMSPILEQTNYRFRNDDGNETTATWKDAQNTNISLSGGQIFRLRILLSETGGATAFAFGELNVSKNGGGYTSVTTSSSNIKFVTSSNVSDNTATTSQLTGGVGSFVAGSVDSNGAVTDVNLLLQNTEFEYVLQIVSADVINGDTFDFESTGVTTYTLIPRLTISGTPNNYTLVASQGSFTLTGQSAGLFCSRKIAPSQGTYSLTGQSANLSYGRRLISSVGTYSLTGQNINFIYARIMSGSVGSYNLSGQSVRLLCSRKLMISQGAYILTGISASLYVLRVLVSVRGLYTLNGQNITFIYNFIIPLSVANCRLGLENGNSITTT